MTTSFQRISLALRAAIAELRPINFFLSTLLFLILFSIAAYVAWKDEVPSYMSLPPEGLSIILLLLGSIPAFFLSASFFTRRLKQTNRAESYFSLPLTTGERFTEALLYTWGVVPLITFGPLILMGTLLSLVSPSWLILPTTSYVLSSALPVIIIYYAISPLWLLPAITFPRKFILAMLSLIGLAVGTFYFATEAMPEYSYIYPMDGSAFDNPNTVGMANHNVLGRNDTLNEFMIKTADNEFLSLFPFLLVAPILLLAAYRALSLKQI